MNDLREVDGRMDFYRQNHPEALGKVIGISAPSMGRILDMRSLCVLPIPGHQSAAFCISTHSFSLIRLEKCGRRSFPIEAAACGRITSDSSTNQYPPMEE
jgi:hypothetical protein